MRNSDPKIPSYILFPMIRYSLIVLVLFLFSCSNVEEEKKQQEEKQKAEQIESLEKQISTIDSTLLDLLQLKMAVKDLEMNSFILVNEAQNVDSGCRKKIKESEEFCRNWELKKSVQLSDEMNKIQISLEKDLESLLKITQTLQELLPNFESYEDLVKFFEAKIIIETDGEMQLKLTKVYFHIKDMENALLLSKKNKELDLKKLR